MGTEGQRIGRLRAAIGLGLTMVAGFVDAFGYLTLQHVYVANMSGNTVTTGIALADGRFQEALLHFYPIGTFLLGLFLSGAIIELALVRGARRVLASAMALEAALLVAFIVLDMLLAQRGSAGAIGGGWPLYAMILIAAGTMGAQNTALRMTSVLTIYTTHVTGTITTFSEEAITYLFGLFNRERRTPLAPGQNVPAGRTGFPLFSGGLWVVYIAGAIGAAALRPLGAPILALPLTIVAGIALLDWIRPLTRLQP